MNSNSNAKPKFKTRKWHLIGIIGLFAHSQIVEAV